MDNKERNYKRTIIITLLLFFILFFIIVIVYEITKKGFNEQELPSTETNYNWYEKGENNPSEISDSQVETESSTVSETENPVNEPENVNEPNSQVDIDTDSDSYARRDWFQLDGIPEDIVSKLNTEKIKNNLQDLLYSQGYEDYTVAKYNEHEVNDSYIEIWFTIDTKPNTVTAQILYYATTDTAIVRLYDDEG